MKMSWKMLSIFPVLYSILSTFVVQFFGVVVISIPGDVSFHFSLMTVNALFGGFLYSNYGMLVGLLDNDTIQKVKGTDIMTRQKNRCVILSATDCLIPPFPTAILVWQTIK